MATITRLKWLSYATTLFMFFATFGGGIVTRTESGLGCGTEWPMCHGKFVPAHTLASVIEYTHRLVSTTAGILAVATLLTFLVYLKQRKDLQFFAALTLVFVIIQGAMGALAVVFSQSPPVMALHLGFAFIALASSLMTSLGSRQEQKARGLAKFEKMPRTSKAFRYFVWCLTVYSYLVVYTGAFVSHTDSAGSCTGLFCTGSRLPELAGGITIELTHRIAGMLLVLLVVILWYWIYKYYKSNRELMMQAQFAVGLILFQVLTGVGMLYTLNRPELYMFVVLAHMTTIAVLFGMLAYMSYLTWRLSKPTTTEK
ncbi:COX15/CtaA family protein [Paenibacillus paridis]|uniref:COX15/CtaA family protein n=1 Tax=Paenibacillus paridis TaxID=2583376 RepID=UPI001EE4E841|nr:COX15/CtaA family protein [Paenibacillus paridis]